ncbi:hypothetical protein L484_015967 [Morus notabilis]|uniref:Uncharacterized protein n=1 Tax=Morus notabilis TaxID=981085 RepID=W9QNI4_9ROSA|nr:hypothetical protein L484_015967 [Morus notabilis]
MVTDGERLISRDLVPFLEFIKGVAVKRRETLLKARKNVRFVPNGEDGDVELERFQHESNNDDQEEEENPILVVEKIQKVHLLVLSKYNFYF